MVVFDLPLHDGHDQGWCPQLALYHGLLGMVLLVLTYPDNTSLVLSRHQFPLHYLCLWRFMEAMHTLIHPSSLFPLQDN